jgi:hypothetical protein
LLIDIPNVGTKNCCRHSKRNCEDGRTGRAQVRQVNPGEPQGCDTRGPERLSLKPAARGTASLDMPTMTQQRMCRIHLQPVKARLASMLNGLGPPGLYDERRSDRQRVDDLDTARPLTGSRPDSEPRQPPKLRRQGRIMGIASHLNYVPDTTCHIEWGAGDYGTAIANITGREGRNRSRR